MRIPDDLAAFLEAQARDASLSVNAWLTRLLEQERDLERKRRLARDWAAYAAEGDRQDVEYAFPAQAEIAAETKVPYRAGKAPRQAGPGKKKP